MNQPNQQDLPDNTNTGPEKEPDSFEMPSDMAPSEPMGGPMGPDQESQSASVAGGGQAQQEKVSQVTVQPQAPVVTSGSSETTPAPPPDKLAMPQKPKGSYFVVILLLILLVLGVIMFSAWRGWITIGFLDPIFGGSTTPTPSLVTPSATTSISPKISSSPEVISNINDETRKQDLAEIKNALTKYYAENSQYPKTVIKTKTSDPGNILSASLVPLYIDSLPVDPESPTYYYGYESDSQSYTLTCILEDKSDTSGTLTGDYNIYKVTNFSFE